MTEENSNSPLSQDTGESDRRHSFATVPNRALHAQHIHVILGMPTEYILYLPYKLQDLSPFQTESSLP